MFVIYALFITVVYLLYKLCNFMVNVIYVCTLHMTSCPHVKLCINKCLQTMLTSKPV